MCTTGRYEVWYEYEQILYFIFKVRFVVCYILTTTPLMSLCSRDPGPMYMRLLVMPILVWYEDVIFNISKCQVFILFAENLFKAHLIICIIKLLFSYIIYRHDWSESKNMKSWSCFCNILCKGQRQSVMTDNKITATKPGMDRKETKSVWMALVWWTVC